MTPPCDFCRDRSYRYRLGCIRCQARDLARMPRRLADPIVEGYTEDFRTLVEEERERDAMQGETA